MLVFKNANKCISFQDFYFLDGCILVFYTHCNFVFFSKPDFINISV